MTQAAGVDDFHDLFIRRRAVSQRHENLMFPALLQKAFVLQYFRRYGNDLHDVGIGRNPGKIGSGEVSRRLGPLIGFAHEGSFQMGAENLSAALLAHGLANAFQRPGHRFLRLGHSRRHKGRDARSRQGLPHRFQCLPAFVHHVGAGAAVDVLVNKARHDEAAVGVNQFRAHAGAELVPRHDFPYVLFIHQNMSRYDFIRQYE